MTKARTLANFIGSDSDVKFDTDTLYVDSTNNRVGIGDATPSATLNVLNDAGGSNSWTNAGSGIIINEADTGSPASIKFGPTTASEGGQIVWGGVAGDGPFIFRNYNTERVRFDEDGRVLIATASTPVNATEGRLQFAGTTKSTSTGSVVRYSNNSGPAHFFFGKTRSTTIGTVGTAVQSGDTLGYMAWAGDDSTDIGTVAAAIDVQVDGTPGSNDMPGRMRFFTTADGSQTPTERMRIDNAGNVGINTTAPSDYTANGNNLVVADVNVGMTLASTSTVGSGALYFADGTSGSQAYRGIINYIHSSDAMGFHTGAAQAMTIDSSQRVLIGYTENVGANGHNANLQVVGQGTADYHGASVNIVGFSNNSNGAYLQFASGRSNTAGIYTLVANSDTTGQINFMGADGTDMNSATAKIQSQVDGNPGSNDMPGRLEFHTTSDGASTPTERMRISEDGTVSIGSAASHPSILRLRDGLNGDTSANTGTGVLTIQGAASTYSSFIGMDATGMSIGLTSSARNLRFVTNSSTAMTIDTSQRVLIGSSTARANFWNSIVSPQFQIEAASDFGRQAAIISSSSNTAYSAVLILAHQLSGSNGGNTLTSNGTATGTLAFQGNDNTQFVPTATIASQVDGTSSANDMPGRLIFATTSDGASSQTERMRINARGDVYTAANSTLSANVMNMYGGTIVIPGNTTRYVTFNGNLLQIGVAEVSIGFYGSSGTGTGGLKVIDAGHWGGTVYHQATELYRFSGNLTINAITETANGWKAEVVNGVAQAATGFYMIHVNTGTQSQDMTALLTVETS